MTWLILIFLFILIICILYLFSRQKLIQERQAGDILLSEAQNDLSRIQAEVNNLHQINQN